MPAYRHVISYAIMKNYFCKNQLSLKISLFYEIFILRKFGAVWYVAGTIKIIYSISIHLYVYCMLKNWQTGTQNMFGGENVGKLSILPEIKVNKRLLMLIGI